MANKLNPAGSLGDSHYVQAHIPYSLDRNSNVFQNEDPPGSPKRPINKTGKRKTKETLGHSFTMIWKHLAFSGIIRT